MRAAGPIRIGTISPACAASTAPSSEAVSTGYTTAVGTADAAGGAGEHGVHAVVAADPHIGQRDPLDGEPSRSARA